jgi:thiamine transport system substrate-binding protein
MKHLLFRIVLCITCCTGALTASAADLTVMTHDSFSMSRDVLDRFEEQHGITVHILQSGDAGAALNQAILARHSPLADVFYGVDNTFLSRALKADIFEAYAPAGLDGVPAELRLDPEHRLIPLDFGDVCLNYDRSWFAARGITPPASLEDLTRPEYRDLLVVQNPATSSPGLAFLLATIGHFGADEAFDFWKRLKDNGVLVTGGWKDAYWGHFTAASKGKRPIVVSYATSPAAEVHFGKDPEADAPTAAVLTPGSAFRQIEFAGILKGSKNPEAAQKFMDFLLSGPFQEDIPLQMFVFPAHAGASLPEVFVKHARQADSPAVVKPEDIDADREAWITRWTQLMVN